MFKLIAVSSYGNFWSFMPIKRQPTDTELDAMAKRFRALWREGEILRPWLRKHHALFRELVDDDGSWAAVAAALTRAGITWRTGRAWSGEGLRREIVRARVLLKKRDKAAQTPALPPSTPAIHVQTAQSSTVPVQPLPARQILAAGDISPPTSGSTVPRFKPASLRPQEPPRPPTPEEEQEREALRRRIFG